jgi:hypothetical protein
VRLCQQALGFGTPLSLCPMLQITQRRRILALPAAMYGNE